MIELQFEPIDEAQSPSTSTASRRASPSQNAAPRLNCTYLARRVYEDMEEEENGPIERRPARRREASAFILCARMPPLSVLRSQATATAKRTRKQAVLDAELQRASEDVAPVRRSVSSSSTASEVTEQRAAKMVAAPASRRPIAPWEVFKAIERHDISTIMAARDQDFNLLVSKSGGNTPLLHCIRLGASHRDVAILITGALSRYINHVDSAPSKQVKATLRSIQINLKLAITAALQANQNELLSSYLQCIVMAEGDRMLQESAQSISLALRAGKSGRPVKAAGDVIRRFATVELRTLAGADAVASVSDFVGNATGDLILLGLWNVVTDSLSGDALPLYAFARDDRLFKAFSDRIEQAKRLPDYRGKLSKLLRSQIEATLQILDGRQIGYRERVERLAAELDDPS